MNTVTIGIPGNPNINEEIAQQRARRYPERQRPHRPNIDNLLIIDAAELLVYYCVLRPDYQEASVLARTTELGTTIGLDQEWRPGINQRKEFWISRIRLIGYGSNPFESNAGIEITLPHHANVEQDDTTKLVDPENVSAFTDMYNAGVFASYPYDGMGWHSNALLKRVSLGGLRLDPLYESRDYEPLDISSDTVGTLDDCIVRGRPYAVDEWAGLLVSNTLASIEGPILGMPL